MFVQIASLALIFSLFSSAVAVKCGGNHKAYVWNCQTLLDNWTLDDNADYSADYAGCLWSGVTRVDSVACKLLENDSCTVVISVMTTNDYNYFGSRTGAEIKQFVQDAITQCTDGDEVSAHDGEATFGAALCLCNQDSASSCF